jgi:hypothetical protein
MFLKGNRLTTFNQQIESVAKRRTFEVGDVAELMAGCLLTLFAGGMTKASTQA